MAFLLFDLFGFWSKKRETYEYGSHRVDAIHAFYDAAAELVISSDRRFYIKSRATYNFLGIGTKVLNLKWTKSLNF